MATLSAAVLRAHEEAEARGAPGYLDPDTGLFVMTRQSLLDRGECCKNGCRHCPYGNAPALGTEETKSSVGPGKA